MHYEIASKRYTKIEASFVHFQKYFVVDPLFHCSHSVINSTERMKNSDEKKKNKSVEKEMANLSRDLYFLSCIALAPYNIAFMRKYDQTMLLSNMLCLHRMKCERKVVCFICHFFSVRYFALNFISFKSFNTISQGENHLKTNESCTVKAFREAKVNFKWTKKATMEM